MNNQEYVIGQSILFEGREYTVLGYFKGVSGQDYISVSMNGQAAYIPTNKVELK